MQALETTQIEDNILSIDLLIKQFEGLDDPNETVDYMQKICALQSLATETQASAKYRMLEAQDEWMEKSCVPKSTATKARMFRSKAYGLRRASPRCAPKPNAGRCTTSTNGRSGFPPPFRTRSMRYAQKLVTLNKKCTTATNKQHF